MKIINKIKQLLKNDKEKSLSELNRQDNRNTTNQSENPSVDLRQREQALFGADHIQQQKLFEKWIIKSTWSLKDEAIPLLCGVNPEATTYSECDETKFVELWEHAQQCVNQGLLSVTDVAVIPEKWQVQPQDVYKWAAISRVELPAQLSSIMEFVLSTVKQADNNVSDTQHLKTDNISDDKERVLGAAFAILAAYPDQCRNSQGRVKANKIVAIMDKKGEFWFGENTPGLSNTARLDLINRWLQTIC